VELRTKVVHKTKMLVQEPKDIIVQVATGKTAKAHQGLAQGAPVVQQIKDSAALNKVHKDTLAQLAHQATVEATKLMAKIAQVAKVDKV